MTTPQDQIVDEMIVRLRELQGSGEVPPLTRQIQAGDGLKGGGTLAEDMTLSLSDEVAALVQVLRERPPASLVTATELTEELTEYASVAAAKQVSYRDFTVTDAPVSTVVSPPLRLDVASVVERVTVTVGTPSNQAVVATVGSKSVTVPAGTESVSETAAVTVGAGGRLTVSVAATSASRIVVSLRVREV